MSITQMIHPSSSNSTWSGKTLTSQRPECSASGKNHGVPLWKYCVHSRLQFLSPEVFRGPVGGGVGEGGGVVVEGDDGDEGEGHQDEEEGQTGGKEFSKNIFVDSFNQ